MQHPRKDAASLEKHKERCPLADSDPTRLQVSETIFIDTPDWLASPCSSCGTFCCSNLPLCDLLIETRNDLLYLADICWFEGMVPVLKQDGQWRLFYNADCRFLHKPTAKCTIHNTPEQSNICKTYPPDRCWYRKAFASAETDLLLRFNGARIERMITLCRFGDDGEILEAPGWEMLQKEFSGLPFFPTSVPASPERMVQAEKRTRGRERGPLFLFPPGKPQKPEHFDLLRFRLGFPGVVLLTSFTLWCFALPAVFKLQVPPDIRRTLYQRLEAGVYDELIVGITEHERYLLKSGAFSRIARYAELEGMPGLQTVPELPEDTGRITC
jgi:hypothetical protein